MKKYFVFQEYSDDKYMIVPLHDNFYLESTTGSFNLIAARLLNISYATYLRFCRDVCGGQILGKGQKYPIVIFSKNKETMMLLDILNAIAKQVVWNREHKDFDKQLSELEAINPDITKRVQKYLNGEIKKL